MSAAVDVPDILKRILAVKVRENNERRLTSPIAELHRRIADQSAPRGFRASLQNAAVRDVPAIIAEVKKASPSKGVIREDYHPADIARSYADAGASCLSVLTDEEFFQGHEQHLVEARNSCSIPVIRKDFIIDSYQLLEARAMGADCILLIVAALNDADLAHLYFEAKELGMDVLVEVHDAAELTRALELGLDLVGINNRDLRTFDVDLDTTLGLLDAIPAEVTVVTESGIHDSAHVELMQRHAVNSFLVGEAFMRSPDPGARLTELFGKIA